MTYVTGATKMIAGIHILLILEFRRVEEHSLRHHGLHVFELAEMEQYLAAAGFEDFRSEMSGSILTFGARKRAA